MDWTWWPYQILKIDLQGFRNKAIRNKAVVWTGPDPNAHENAFIIKTTKKKDDFNVLKTVGLDC